MDKATIERIVSMEVEHLTAYLKADKKSAETVRTYTGIVRMFVTHVGKSGADLTPDDMQSYKAHLAETRGDNSMYAHITALNQWTGQVLKRPELRMRNVRMVTVEKIPLTVSEIERIREAAGRGARAERDRAIIDVLYYAGLRVNEVAHLTVSSIDLEGMRLRVNCGKGKNYQLVPLAGEAVASLRAYLGVRKPAKGSEAWLFLNAHGTRMSDDSIWRMTIQTAVYAGIEKKVHPHIFRHSLLSHLAQRGVPTHVIMQISRHKNLATLARYLHANEKETRDWYDGAVGKAKEMPAPAPAPVKRPTNAPPLYAAPAVTREDILRARLAGTIDDNRMDMMLAMIEGDAAAPAPRIPSRVPSGYA